MKWGGGQQRLFDIDTPLSRLHLTMLLLSVSGFLVCISARSLLSSPSIPKGIMLSLFVSFSLCLSPAISVCALSFSLSVYLPVFASSSHAVDGK